MFWAYALTFIPVGFVEAFIYIYLVFIIRRFYSLLIRYFSLICVLIAIVGMPPICRKDLDHS